MQMYQHFFLFFFLVRIYILRFEGSCKKYNGHILAACTFLYCPVCDVYFRNESSPFPPHLSHATGSPCGKTKTSPVPYRLSMPAACCHLAHSTIRRTCIESGSLFFFQISAVFCLEMGWSTGDAGSRVVIRFLAQLYPYSGP